MNVQKVLFTAKKGEREVNYRNQSDETLVLMTLAGEKEAFEELVIRHRNTVIAAAASVTHNHFMAEDASQDAFVTAWMKLDTLAEALFGIALPRTPPNGVMGVIYHIDRKKVSDLARLNHLLDTAKGRMIAHLKLDLENDARLFGDLDHFAVLLHIKGGDLH